MNSSNNYKEALVLTIGELLVAALTVLGFLVADIAFGTGFAYNVITGALLGCGVIVLNFFFLTLSVNRAVDKYLLERGKREMSEEEAEKFTNEHSATIQNSIKTSYIIRTFTILAALVIAFLFGGVFNPIATAIPLFCYRPILTVSELIRRKYDKAPDPDNFIEYKDDGNKENEEKEKI